MDLIRPIRPAHIETDLSTEEFVCRVCGERRAWQSRAGADMPIGEIVVRGAQFVEAHEKCGRHVKLIEFLRRGKRAQEAVDARIEEAVGERLDSLQDLVTGLEQHP